MDASTEPSLAGLAINNPGEFVVAFLERLGYPPAEYDRSSNGSKSSGATLDHLYGTYGSRKNREPVDAITLKQVVHEGGGEGEGESVYRVYAVMQNGIEFAWFGTNGYYASEYGTDWDDQYTTLYPRQVMVTQYHTTKE